MARKKDPAVPKSTLVTFAVYSNTPHMRSLNGPFFAAAMHSDGSPAPVQYTVKNGKVRTRYLTV